jgi:Zn-dependent protease with chaperone function
MTWLTLLPAAVTLALGVALGRLAPPLHPVWSARLLVTVAATTSVAVLGTAAFLGVNYVAGHMPRAANRLPEWALFGDDRAVPGALGVPAIVLACLSVRTAGRLAARWIADVRAAQTTSAGPMDTDVPLALAVPGRRGGVLVSRGLLRELSAAELEVVFQHERSHLRHRHHRYLALGTLAARTVPFLAALDARLRFAVERWADEDAAEAVADRALVAHTIARVALARSPDRRPLPAFADSGVVQRVRALLDTPPGKNPVTGPVIVAGTGITTSGLASSALQLDQFLAFALL